jgi:hypothetical protein
MAGHRFTVKAAAWTRAATKLIEEGVLAEAPDSHGSRGRIMRREAILGLVTGFGVLLDIPRRLTVDDNRGNHPNSATQKETEQETENMTSE